MKEDTLSTQLGRPKHQKQQGICGVSCSMTREISQRMLDLYFQMIFGRGNRMSFQLNRCILRRKWYAVKNIATKSPNLATVRDRYGYTPLHHIIKVYHDDLAQPVESEIIEDVLYAFPEAAVLQSHRGWTPLHFAVQLNLPSHIIKGILRVMPQAANIPTNDGLAPIFLCRLKRIRSLWEIRTERAARDLKDRYRQEWRTILLLLKASAHGSVNCNYNDDGETPSNGVNAKQFRILHAACGTPCPLNILNVIIKLYPGQAKEQDEDGNFPLSILVANFRNPSTTTTTQQSKLLIDCANECVIMIKIINLNPDAVRTPNREGRLPLHSALGSGTRDWYNGVQILIDLYPESINITDPRTRMLPFMLAGSSICSCIDTIYHLLRGNPELVVQS